jgi:hypothetical protein
MPPEYDASRATYTLTPHLDPRFTAAIEQALGDASPVVVAGAYESKARELIPYNPALPGDSADAALAVMVTDPVGLTGLARVARRRAVAFTYDPDAAEALWLVRDYLPELAEHGRARWPGIEDVVEAFGGSEASAERVPVPHDCRDGLLGAYWRRPERYLDRKLPHYARLEPGTLEPALDRLANDLDSGAWRRRYGGLLSRDELDVGYRLVTADLSG